MKKAVLLGALALLAGCATTKSPAVHAVPHEVDEITGDPIPLASFGIFESGRVGNINVIETSGMVVYDDWAVRAIRTASPFPRVPAELMASAKAGSPDVKIRAEFIYKLITPSPCGDGTACD